MKTILLDQQTDISEALKFVIEIISALEHNGTPKEEKKGVRYYVNEVAKTFQNKTQEDSDWSYKNTMGMLEVLYDVSPETVYNILVKQIAIDMDRKYEDHILASPSLYTISLISGGILGVNPHAVKSTNNIALFRSIEEAEEAKKILEDFLYVIFNGK